MASGRSGAATGALRVLRERNFLKFWIGQTVSVFGSSVSGFALPMTAILILHGTAMQMGLLRALSGIPALLAALPIGVAVDRLRRRRLMIVVDLGRACLMAAIPVLLIVHRLTLGALYAVSAAVGILTIAFATAYQSFVPQVAERDRLVDANASMQFSHSVAGMAGPGTAGLLIGVLAAPMTLLVDAASFVVSAASLAAVSERVELAPRRVDSGAMADIIEAVAFLARHSVLGPLTLAGGAMGGCFSGFLTVYFLYLNRVAGLSPIVMGAILSAGAVGATVGALVTKRLSSWLGSMVATVLTCYALFALAAWMVPLAAGPQWLRAIWFTAAAILAFFAGYTASVTVITLRQTLTPERLLGRVSAATQLVDGALTALGALAGGALGTWIGLRSTLMAASACMSIVVVWLWLSRVRAASIVPVQPAQTDSVTP